MPNPVLPMLPEQNLAEVRAVAPGFRSYTARGEAHAILRRPELYSAEVNGTRRRDWVPSLEAGRPVDNVILASDR